MGARIVAVEFDPPARRSARLVTRSAPMRGTRIAAGRGPGNARVDQVPPAFARKQ